METQVKKREWVKNVAIIFLAVLLVLTFFSNTFLNASLPEVATQTITRGSIVAKIRGSGTVVANQTYEVNIDQTREVSSVLVKEGDEVSTGDVLFTLADAESSELETAKEALRQLNLSYQKALINAADADYAKENRDIRLAKEAITKAESERDELQVSERDIAIAKDNVAAAKDNVTFVENRLTIAKQEQEDIIESIGESSGTEKAIRKQIEAKEEELSAAEESYDTEWRKYGGIYGFIEAQAKDAILADGKRVTEEETKVYMPYIVYEIISKMYIEKDDNGETPNDVYTWTHGDGKYVKDYLDKSDDYLVADFKKNAEAGHYSDSDYQEAYNAIIDASSKIDTLIDEIKTLEAQLKDNGTSKEYSDKVKNLERELEAAKTAQTQAETTLTELQEKKTKYNEAQSNIETLTRNLEDLVFSLAQQQKSDNKNAQLEALELQEMANQIADKKAEIEKLTTGDTGGEVKAPVNGIVRSISISAGQKTTPGTALASIEIPDMGYSMSFSVTNEQARKVHTGDTATISNYYWGNQIDATLTAIKPDPKNPQSGKILQFDLSGDVTVGSNLTLSIGQKSAEYDYVVPNSAIKSDSNGSFILVVTAKSSPLGNRYTATRVDVNILASDDTNTAVSGGLNAGDFVITTSTKPISNGDKVRMPDAS